MSNLDPIDQDIINSFLLEKGYDSIMAWAKDSDYRLDEAGYWRDEDGGEVDLDEQIYYALEAAGRIGSNKPMTFGELLNKVLAILPEATLHEDSDGQVIINTNLTCDRDLNLHQFEEEPF